MELLGKLRRKEREKEKKWSDMAKPAKGGVYVDEHLRCYTLKFSRADFLAFQDMLLDAELVLETNRNIELVERLKRLLQLFMMPVFDSEIDLNAKKEPV